MEAPPTTRPESSHTDQYAQAYYQHQDAWDRVPGNNDPDSLERRPSERIWFLDQPPQVLEWLLHGVIPMDMTPHLSSSPLAERVINGVSVIDGGDERNSLYFREQIGNTEGLGLFTELLCQGEADLYWDQYNGAHTAALMEYKMSKNPLKRLNPNNADAWARKKAHQIASQACRNYIRNLGSFQGEEGLKRWRAYQRDMGDLTSLNLVDVLGDEVSSPNPSREAKLTIENLGEEDIESLLRLGRKAIGGRKQRDQWPLAQVDRETQKRAFEKWRNTYEAAMSNAFTYKAFAKRIASGRGLGSGITTQDEANAFAYVETVCRELGQRSKALGQAQSHQHVP